MISAISATLGECLPFESDDIVDLNYDGNANTNDAKASELFRSRILFVSNRLACAWCCCVPSAAH